MRLTASFAARSVAIVALILAGSAETAIAATPTLFGGGGGDGSNILPPTRDEAWSEPPDLEGMIASSEMIAAFGFDTEIANDFYLTEGNTLIVARWWGGYFNLLGCDNIGYATHWNLRFYDDAGCMPGTLIREYVNSSVSETYIHCQTGGYPVFRYETSVSLDLPGNTLFWFSAQAADHVYPPQCGRLASGGVVNCDAVFRSTYFGYPDWIPCIDVFGVSFDVSQEFQTGIGGGYGVCCLPDGSCVETYPVRCGDWLHGEWDQSTNDCAQSPCEPPQACCFTGGLCVMLTDWGCADQHGETQGVGSVCDPNPCPPAPAGCIDYGNYLHWSAAIPVPGSPGPLAAGDTHVYALAGSALVVADPDPLDPHVVGTVNLREAGRDLAVRDTIVCVADGTQGLQVVDVALAANPRVIGHLELAGTATWIAVSGTLACVTGPDIGFKVADITNPRTPHLLGGLAEPIGSVATAGSLAFVVGGANLTVVDLASPASPQIVGAVPLPGEAFDVAISGAYAYVAASNAGTAVIDIADPANPLIVAVLDSPYQAWSIAIAGVCAYVADGVGLEVIDIADPTHPRQVYFMDSAYCADVAAAPGACYCADVSSSEIDVADISNPMPAPILGGLTMPSGIAAIAVPGNGPSNLLYVADGGAGLQIVDVTDPSAPHVVGGAYLPGPVADVAIVGNLAYVAATDGGLQIIDIADPQNMQLLGGVATPQTAHDVAVAGTHAYVLASGSYSNPYLLFDIDITDPMSPAILGSFSQWSPSRDVVVSGTHAYLAGGDHQLEVVDVSDPANLQLVGFMDGIWLFDDLAIRGEYLFVACDHCGLQVVDIADPTNPRAVAGVTTPDWANGLALRGDQIYMSSWHEGMHVIDVSDPVHPRTIGGRETPVDCFHPAVAGPYAFVADGSNLLVLPAQCEPAGVEDGGASGGAGAGGPGAGDAGATTATGATVLALHAVPNPAFDQTAIRFELPAPCVVRASIHDVVGRVVRRLQEGPLAAGHHELRWDGRDEAGRAAPAGVYVARVSVHGETRSVPVVIVR